MNRTRLKAVLAWLFVILPLAWGVTQSVQKAVPLFRPETEAAPAEDRLPSP